MTFFQMLSVNMKSIENERFSVMKRRYYLIDTENVGDRWIDFIGEMKEEDIFIVFYTKNHSKMLEECYLAQRYNTQIRWVECLSGNNALDYQLMGVLSYLIASHTDVKYSIYSNDKDYQDVIDFWKQRGVDINRVGFDANKKKTKKRNKSTSVEMEHNVSKKKKVEEAEQLNPVADENKIQNENQELQPVNAMDEEAVLNEIAKVIPVSNMNGWYVVLVSLLGQETGRDLYVKIREDEERKAEWSRYLISDIEERNLYLIAMLYKQNQLDTSKAAEAWKIVKSHNRKNKKAIKADFDKHFGKKTKEQTQYYKIAKPIIGILKGK